MWCIAHNHFPRIYIGKRICKDNLLNFFTKEEITEPIMRGKDHKGRKFLIVKYLIDNTIEIIDVYLQNSPLWETTWIVCGNITENLFEQNSILRNHQIVFIESLFRGNYGIVNDSIKPFNKQFFNKKVIINWK